MAQKVVIDIDVNSNKGVKDVEKLNKELQNTSTQVKDTNKSLEGASNTLDGFTGGAVSKVKNFGKSIKGLTTGFKSLRIAIIGTGIGALLVAIVALRAAFTSSEEGQNKFAKIMGIIGSVTGNLVDIIANLGEGIISAFENPKQALIDFKNLIVENITNRFNAVIDTLGYLGSAFKKVFSGDFKGALDDAKKAGSSYVDALTGVEDSINKVAKATNGFVKELKEEAKIAGQIADQRAKADKVERKLIVERAEADRKIAELREKSADRDKVSAKERIEALEEAGRVAEEITNKEIAAAKLRLDAKVAENKLSKSTKEDLDEEANLKARLIQLETNRLRQQKSITAEISGARKEEKARIKAEEDAERTAKEEQQKIDDAKEAERNKTKELAEEERLRKLKEQADAEIALEQRKSQVKKKALNDLISIAGAETKVGKALLIAKQGLALKEMIMEAKKTITFSTMAAAKTSVATAEGTAQTAKVGFPQNIPLLIGYAAQAVGIFSAMKSAVGKANGVASSFGGGGGGVSTGTPPSVPSIPPAFNVVGQGGSSQLAEAIGGQSKEPTRAYVVSNDVTTAQSMDRNIVDGASI